jgi:YrbI family 3-deoxy-D-manno-octulosonate 8-phosphate phosphatase
MGKKSNKNIIQKAKLLIYNYFSTNRLKKQIKLFLSDVDGVLTDGGMYYSENGEELKKFNTRDGMGFQILREAGIKTGIITSETTKIVERRASKLQIDYVSQGKKNGGKLTAALEICEKEGINLSEVAYIGDDINCLELLSKVGYAACPSDAVKAVKNIPGILILSTKGGAGAVREFIEYLID